jgi:preprotein translocase subunit SecG
MQTLLNVVHIITCVLLILVVLIQSGKGAEISASFGGSSQTVFGSSGGANFFTRLTTILAGIFMLTSVTLTMMANREKKSVFEGQPSAATPADAVPAPAQPAQPEASAPAAQGGGAPKATN